MASDNDKPAEEEAAPVVESVEEEQGEIIWADKMIDEFRPIPTEKMDHGKTAVEGGESEPEAEAEAVTEAKAEVEATEGITISAADYAVHKVEITAEDGSTGFKTVKQLVDEGMYEADYTRKSQDNARQRDQLKQDQGVIDLINNDKQAREYMLKRIDDIKAGRIEDDMEIPADVLEQLPWLKSLVDKVKQHDVEVHKSRTSQEQAQANQTVGKIETVIGAAQTAIEKETGMKLEPRAFQARVGKVIIDSLSDNVPEENRINTAGNMILADKNYFLSKARESFQQEIQLANDKTIAAAQQERTKKAQKPKPLTGGTASSAPKDGVTFKIVKDKDGRPDMDAFLENAFTQKRG